MIVNQLVKTDSKVVAETIAISRERHWGARPIATAEMIDIPVYINTGDSQWWLIPEEQYTKPIVKEAKARLEILKLEGIPVVGTIVAEEAPLLLEGQTDYVAATRLVLKSIKRIAVNSVVALSQLMLVAGSVSIISLAALVDPAYIAVIQDPKTGEQTWVVIATWYH